MLRRALLVMSSTLEDTVVEVANLVEDANLGQYKSMHANMLPCALHANHEELHLTPEEYAAFLSKYQQLVAGYQRKRKSTARKPVDIFWMSFPNAHALESCR